jgi:hypothetical protein
MIRKKLAGLRRHRGKVLGAGLVGLGYIAYSKRQPSYRAYNYPYKGYRTYRY